MTRNEFTTQAWHQLPPTVQAKLPLDAAGKLWWTSPTETCWRLSELGFRMLTLSPTPLPHWDFKLERLPMPWQLLTLSRHCQYPYAITGRRLSLFDSGDAMMAALYQDAGQWMQQLHRHGG
jgi:hypothetical protein